MLNKVEKYFNEALSKFNKNFDRNKLPIPEVEEDPSDDNSNIREDDIYSPWPIDNDNDALTTIDDILTTDEVTKRLTGESSHRNLSKDDADLLDGGVREIGLEVYAFYKSLRFIDKPPFRGKWGIFYLRQGIDRVFELMQSAHPGFANWKLAYEFLRQHELYHYQFDLYALSLEAVNNKALYEPLKYCYRRHPSHQIEEALANRQAWVWAKRKSISMGDFAFDFMKLQPNAYSRFDENHFSLRSTLASNLIDLNISSSASRDDHALWVAHIPDELNRRSLCPEYVILPARLSTWISPTFKLPDVRSIVDSVDVQKLLNKTYKNLNSVWSKTKERLIESRHLPGLQFKRWEKDGLWSVRINDNFRAHLKPLNLQSGQWETIELGPHKKMGHG
jgi:hypothetical protein